MKIEIYKCDRCGLEMKAADVIRPSFTYISGEEYACDVLEGKDFCVFCVDEAIDKLIDNKEEKSKPKLFVESEPEQKKNNGGRKKNATEEQIIESYKNLGNCAKVASELHVAPDRVVLVVKRYEEKTGKKLAKKHGSEPKMDHSVVIELHKQGKSIKEIMEATGYSQSQAWKIVNKHKVEIKKQEQKYKDIKYLSSDVDNFDGLEYTE